MIAAERSDWNVLLDNRRFTVQEPEPLNMTDTEIVRFFSRACSSITWNTFERGWVVTLDDGHKVTGDSVEGAIGKAAALAGETNE